ncbi:MAG: hypothetical protein QNK04_09935 [Myxococcota bacterium]|nr:hypothetical protein [Myxococcota bacterium]
MRACQAAIAALACSLASATGAAEPPGSGARAELARVDGELAEIEALLAAAYFRTALSLVEATRELLPGNAPPVRARRARLEVMAATGELALGRSRQAHASMRRALEADPALALDEVHTSPRVIALLREARAGVETPEVARGSGGAP